MTAKYVPPGKTLIFPKARSFFDLFDGVSDATLSAIKIHDGRDGLKMGSYTIVRSSGEKLWPHGNHHSMYVRPKPMLVEWAKRHMLNIENDTTNFEIIVRGAREALVTISHGIINGNRWLAYIDPKTIPGYGTKV